MPKRSSRIDTSMEEGGDLDDESFEALLAEAEERPSATSRREVRKAAVEAEASAEEEEEEEQEEEEEASDEEMEIAKENKAPPKAKSSKAKKASAKKASAKKKGRGRASPSPAKQ